MRRWSRRRGREGEGWEEGERGRRVGGGGEREKGRKGEK